MHIHVITYTLVELPSLSASYKSLPIWIPGHTCQTVFVGLAHFRSQLASLETKSVNKNKNWLWSLQIILGPAEQLDGWSMSAHVEQPQPALQYGRSDLNESPIHLHPTAIQFDL